MSRDAWEASSVSTGNVMASPLPAPGPAPGQHGDLVGVTSGTASIGSRSWRRPGAVDHRQDEMIDLTRAETR